MTGAETRCRLLGVALGAAPVDLLALGGDVVNLYTGEVVRWDGAVADGRIAPVGPDLATLAGPGTERFDVRGKVLIPGFLDAAAGQRAVGIGGGFVVVDGRGAVRAELSLPLGGIAAAVPASELAYGLEMVTGALRDLGSGLARPLLTLQALTFSAIPALRLTTRGLLAVKSREHVPALL